MARSLARIEHDQQKKPDSPKRSNQITKLTELTPLEAAYSDQIKVIREVIPSDLQHMQPAMLYFRVSLFDHWALCCWLVHIVLYCIVLYCLLTGAKSN